MKNKDIVVAFVLLFVVLFVIPTVAGWARDDHAELRAGLVELHERMARIEAELRAGLAELHAGQAGLRERMGRIEAALEEHLHKP